MAVPEKFVNIGIVGFTDKGEYAPENIYMMNDIVHRDNGLWRCLVDNTTGIEPEENHNWTVFIQSSKELGGITATDSKGIMGPEGEMVSAQELMEKLSAPEFEDFSQEGAAVPDARTAVSKILSGVPIPKIFSKMKAALMGLVTLGEMRAFLVNNGLCTEEGKYFLDAAYGKTLKDAIDSTNSNLQEIGTVLQSSYVGPNILMTELNHEYDICTITLPKGKWLLIGCTLANGTLTFTYGSLFSGRSTQKNHQSNLAFGLAIVPDGIRSSILRLIVGGESEGYSNSEIHTDSNYCGIKAIKIG